MGVQERREREREQRRNDIIDAAENVFFTKGLSLSTMDDVAESAELSKGTLYLYFKSKQELYLGINQRGFAKLFEMFKLAVRDETRGIEKMRAIGYAYFEFSKQYPDYYASIMYFENSVMDFSADDDLISRFHKDGKAVLQFVQNTIKEGVEDGTINPNSDVEKLAFILWGQVSGVIQIIAKISKHPAKEISFKPNELFEDYIQLMGRLLINTNQEENS